MGDLIGILAQAGSASLFESGLEHAAMSALNHARADRKSLSPSSDEAEAIGGVTNFFLVVKT